MKDEDHIQTVDGKKHIFPRKVECGEEKYGNDMRDWEIDGHTDPNDMPNDLADIGFIF